MFPQVQVTFTIQVFSLSLFYYLPVTPCSDEAKTCTTHSTFYTVSQTLTQAYWHSQEKHLERHIHTLAHRHTDTGTYIHTRAHTHTQTHTHTHTHTLKFGVPQFRQIIRIFETGG